ANPDIARSAQLDLSLSPLPPQAGAAFAMPEPLDAPEVPTVMAPGEVRVLAYAPSVPVIRPTCAASVPDPVTVVTTRIAIEALAPSAPYGHPAVERLVGEAG